MISLGMQRRAALARAFVLEPEVLLMDEPFVSLDDPTAQDLRELLVELWSARPDDSAVRDPRPPRGGDARHPHLAPVERSCDYRRRSPVRLSVADRTDREKVRTEQRRIFGEA